jgi:hypothetical protein
MHGIGPSPPLLGEPLLRREVAVGEVGRGLDSDERGEVTRIALERASQVYGEKVEQDQAFSVGDTPLDVTGAHAARAAQARRGSALSVVLPLHGIDTNRIGTRKGADEGDGVRGPMPGPLPPASKSSAQQSAKASSPSRPQAANADIKAVTFSSDVTYSESPAASRALLSS